MALKLTLKANERVVAGGAVLRNATGRTIHLTVENEVPLLRETDILGEKDVDTPCKRIYFAVQAMYVDGERLETYRPLYHKLAAEVCAAAPSTAAIVQTVDDAVSQGRYYQALKEARKLIVYEETLTRNAATSD
jgi:flagellar protein FlbT